MFRGLRHAVVALGTAIIASMLFAGCSGDSDGKKARLSEGCVINSECDAPLVCAFRRCHTECEDSRDCPGGTRCMASDRPFHVCQLAEEVTCSYNSQCPEGQLCGVDGECRDQCASDRDCVTGQLCAAGTCAEKEELGPDHMLTPAVGDGGVKPTDGIPCAYNSQCADPLICRNGKCALECLGNTDCAPGETCVASRCTPASGEGGTPVVPLPDAGARCAYSSECPVPLVCRGGTCAYECLASIDCAPGETCDNSRCKGAAPLPPADAATPPPDAPAGWGQRCQYHSQCPTPLACQSGACAYQCLGDADCAPGEDCRSFRCQSTPPVATHDSGHSQPDAGTGCQYNSQCPAPLLCQGGVCAYECLADIDCASTETCQGSRCQPRPPTSTGDASVVACRYNSQCTAPLVCRGGACGAECLGDADCLGGTACVSSRCTPVVVLPPEGGAPDAGTSAEAGGCATKSCLALSKNCGLVPDGCGGSVYCGNCSVGESCGGGGIANVCAPGSCQPRSCQAQGKDCGSVSDGCAWQLQCGTCTAPQTCGGGGVSNVCGCTPDLAAACAGKDCGTVVTSCGTTASCGTCTAPSTCGGSGTVGLCGCTKTTCLAQGKDCGMIPDGCGGLVDCGVCASGICGGLKGDGSAGTPNVCGPGVCTPTDCAALGKTCGVVSDGCGDYLTCGSCTAPETCGGGGTANVCGCTKTTCPLQNKNCGTIPDGCTGVLDCGGCTSPSTCGGGGTANVCGCTPSTCAALNKNCGTIPDGCGGLVPCGACTSPEVCGGGGIPNVCAVSQKPPSCLGGGQGAGNTCGYSNDDCCSSPLIPAGSFNRSNNATYPGSVAGFRLDRYKVTVGRFRAFLQTSGGTQVNPPVAWSGSHPAIANSGWNPAWNGSLAASVSSLTSVLRADASCWNGGSYGTWTASAAQSDNNPMNCVNWFEAMAFCAWDGGWLVTEVQYNYAQEGGNEQRYYPWSVPPGSATVDLTYTNSYGFPGSPNYPISVGAKSPKGDGRWGHTDMNGNLSEWMMDTWNTPFFFSTCADCAYLGTANTDRVVRSNSWNDGVWNNAQRSSRAQTYRDSRVGFRCARQP